MRKFFAFFLPLLLLLVSFLVSLATAQLINTLPFTFNVELSKLMNKIPVTHSLARANEMFNWGQVWIARKMYEIKSETITTLTTFSSATSFTSLSLYIDQIHHLAHLNWWNRWFSPPSLPSLVWFTLPLSLFTLSIFLLLCSCHSRWSISVFLSAPCNTFYSPPVSQFIASLDHSLMPPLDIFTRLTTLTKSLIHSVG